MNDEEEKAILAAMAKVGPSSLLTCRVALKETLRDLEEERESVRLAQEATKRQAELRAAAESEVARLRRDLRDSQNYRIEAAHDRGIEIERLRARLAEERATSARLRGLLGEVEWNSGFWGDDSGCSICGAPKTSGHAIDCRLAAALEKDHG